MYNDYDAQVFGCELVLILVCVASFDFGGPGKMVFDKSIGEGSSMPDE